MGATVDQVASKLIEMRNNQNDAPPPNPPIMLPEVNQAGSGTKRRSQTVYKKNPNEANIHLTSGHSFIIYKMATIGVDVTKQITSEVDSFGSIMQQNEIENELNREYALLATIQPGIAIQLTVNRANDLYLNLNNSRLHVIAEITKADETNVDANTAIPINLTLHSMFREIGLEFNG